MKKILWLCVLACMLWGIELRVGATPIPHAQILEQVKTDLEQKGIKLVIVPFADYVIPNLALNEKALDANYFQHRPYLEKMINEKGLSLKALGKVHLEPLGLYSKRFSNLEMLKNNLSIAIPSDPTNFARALILLHQLGLIKLKDPQNLASNETDIISNPHQLQIIPIEASLLPRVLGNVDMAVINGNFALQSGLSNRNTLALEGKESPYANIVVTYEGISKEKQQALDELMKALQSEKIRDFIQRQYQGEILPAF